MAEAVDLSPVVIRATEFLSRSFSFCQRVTLTDDRLKLITPGGTRGEMTRRGVSVAHFR